MAELNQPEEKNDNTRNGTSTQETAKSMAALNIGKMTPQEDIYVMISYEHKSGTKYQERLSKELRNDNIKVWVDTDQMHGYLYECMAKTIASAKLMVVLLSEGYAQSKNCNFELVHAQKCKTELLFVKVEQYNPPLRSGISLIMRDSIYYKVYGQFDDTAKIIAAIKRSYQAADPNQTITYAGMDAKRTCSKNTSASSTESLDIGKGVQESSEHSPIKKKSSSSSINVLTRGNVLEEANKNIDLDASLSPDELYSRETNSSPGELDITAILDDRDILKKITEMLEVNPDKGLQVLAHKCNVNDLSTLKVVVPCQNFFKNMACNKGEITLLNLKNLIENGLRLKNKSVFPPIEEAIKYRRVGFTLESSLGDLFRSKNTHWPYILENVAFKLLRNDCQLTSWEDIASHYGYTYNEIKAFTSNFEEERPTVKLFDYLASCQKVLSIEDLKGHLKDMNRYDIVRVLDAWLAKRDKA